MATAISASDENRTRQLMRTVTSEAIQMAATDLWVYPDPNESAPPPDPKAKAKAKAAPKGELAEESPPMEAENDPDGGGLFLSHAWGQPDEWPVYFGAGRFQDAKHLQVSSSLQCAVEKGLLPQGKEPRVWVDCASLPDAVEQRDHPLEELTLGLYAMPVKDLKALLPSIKGDGTGYTILHLDKDGYHFEGTMTLRDWDEFGRPLANAKQHAVHWDILPGWYHVRSAQVMPEDRISPTVAAQQAHLRPGKEQMRKWCNDLKLQDEVWVEFTLGSIRAECMLLAEPMLALHSMLLAVVTWNYFDRLWPLVEWTVFCSRCGPDRVQLAADHFSGPCLVEYHRALRRLSVVHAGVRDPRDRELLLGMIKRIFKCDTTDVIEKYVKPSPGQLTEPVINKVTDYSAIERYARVTAIAIFAHEYAPLASRSKAASDEAGWAALAEELGLVQLQAALTKCKPYDWAIAVSSKPEEEQEDAFEEMVEGWWTKVVLPVLEDEKKRAIR